MKWGYCYLSPGVSFVRCLQIFSVMSITKKIPITPKSYWYSSSTFSDSMNYPNSEVLHAKLIKNGCVGIRGNHLLNLYAKSQNLEKAHKMFEEIPQTDVFSWTVLISGFARIGLSADVLGLFTKMQDQGVCPNQFTLSIVLKSCSSNVNDSRIGKGIHGWILRNGVDLDAVLNNSILDYYVKCRCFGYAEKWFGLMAEKDTVSWNIMMSSYLQIGDMQKSVDLFRQLPGKDAASWNTMIDGLMRNGCERVALELLHKMVAAGPAFNKLTFSIALVLASSLSVLGLGKQIHTQVLKVGVLDDGFVRNSLIDMYCKCGEMEKASVIFKHLPRESSMMNFEESCDDAVVESVSWSSMVSGYVQNGGFEDALKTFSSMICSQVEVDKFTLTSVVSACASAGVLELGRQVHGYIQKIGHGLDVFLGSSIIDMYVKCGSLNDAWLIFNQAKDRNVVLWTSMISGCALHGQGREAVRLFELMINEGITPNEVSFVGVLTACSHAGLLEEGCKYFRLMREVYGIRPGAEHFTCMVDLYGRAGCLNEIKEFIHNNAISKLSPVWRSFLSSCRVHKNIEMGIWVCKKLLELEPFDAGPYILFSSICATEQRWEEAAKIRSLMQQRGVKKNPSQSWIQLKNQVHSFVMGDRSHPQDTRIYSYLDELIGRLKEIGYSTDVTPVMQDVEQEQRQVLLGYHSEKLAIAYGIISTAPGIPIRVMKNLRVCIDCHNFIKYTSELLGREIIIRDIHRFHHFKHGHCSCADYW